MQRYEKNGIVHNVLYSKKYHYQNNGIIEQKSIDSIVFAYISNVVIERKKLETK